MKTEDKIRGFVRAHVLIQRIGVLCRDVAQALAKLRNRVQPVTSTEYRQFWLTSYKAS